MGYKDKEKRREYARQYKAARRADWFKDKTCVVCGTKENLEIHHIDPKTKVSHRVWSWSKVRRDAELAKCEVRCKLHHKEITAELHAPEAATHGSSGFWNYKKCRCDKCREWHRNSMREFRARS
jgi:hypothetical protein